MQVHCAPPAQDIKASRRSLIVAAERMFADQGFDTVSLTQVVHALGQRNASAVQYHFGSREGLVEAVFEYRMDLINQRRHAAMELVLAEGRQTDVRALVGAWVLPFAEELRPREDGNYTLRFLERLLRNEPLFLQQRTISGLHVTGWKVSDHLQEALAYLPHEIALMRLRMVRFQIISGLAAIEAQGDPDTTEFLIEGLIDGLAGALTAPVSVEAMQALKRAAGAPSLSPQAPPQP